MKSRFLALALGLSTVAILNATPAFAQKSGSTSPTPVTEVEKPARTAVILSYLCSGNICTTTQQIPTGMRLVVESVTGQFGQSSSAVIDMYLACILDGNTFEILMPATTQRQVSLTYWSMHEHSVRAYSDVAPLVELNTSANASSFVNVVGYLVKK